MFLGEKERTTTNNQLVFFQLLSFQECLKEKSFFFNLPVEKLKKVGKKNYHSVLTSTFPITEHECLKDRSSKTRTRIKKIHSW